jgi:hypothetical protein
MQPLHHTVSPAIDRPGIPVVAYRPFRSFLPAVRR